MAHRIVRCAARASRGAQNGSNWAKRIGVRRHAQLEPGELRHAAASNGQQPARGDEASSAVDAGKCKPGTVKRDGGKAANLADTRLTEMRALTNGADTCVYAYIEEHADNTISRQRDESGQRVFEIKVRFQITRRSFAVLVRQPFAADRAHPGAATRAWTLTRRRRACILTYRRTR